MMQKLSLVKVAIITISYSFNCNERTHIRLRDALLMSTKEHLK